MTTYERADDDTVRLLQQVMKKHHKPLLDAGVTVQVLTAEPALKHGGYPAYAMVRIMQLKARVAGQCDAEIVIDGGRWPLIKEQHEAILDHELTHLELVMSDTFDDARKRLPKVDDSGRPRLKMKKHDHHFGWFDDVAERHPKHSIECQQAEQLVAEKGQLYFAFVKQTRAA